MLDRRLLLQIALPLLGITPPPLGFIDPLPSLLSLPLDLLRQFLVALSTPLGAPHAPLVVLYLSPGSPCVASGFLLPLAQPRRRPPTPRRLVPVMLRLLQEVLFLLPEFLGHLLEVLLLPSESLCPLLVVLLHQLVVLLLVPITLCLVGGRLDLVRRLSHVLLPVFVKACVFSGLLGLSLVTQGMIAGNTGAPLEVLDVLLAHAGVFSPHAGLLRDGAAVLAGQIISSGKIINVQRRRKSGRIHILDFVAAAAADRPTRHQWRRKTPHRPQSGF